MQAAMMYLRVLREARKLSQADIARAAEAFAPICMGVCAYCLMHESRRAMYCRRHTL